jgi:hypothetical protein
MPLTAEERDLAERNKFEDNLNDTVEASIQAAPLRRSAIRIFDNKVERASREKRSGLA